MGRCNELLLDTNFLIECAKRRLLDSAREAIPGARLVTLQAVVDELEAHHEAVALEIIKTEGIAVKPGKGYADKAIADYAAKGGVAVATNDRGLRKKLLAKGIAIVFPTTKGCGIAGGVV